MLQFATLTPIIKPKVVSIVSLLLPERLRFLHKHSQLSQQRLAEMLGLPRGTYTHYELGKRTPDLDLLMKIADAYQVSLDYLTGYTDRRPTPAEWSADHPDQADAAKSGIVYPLAGRYQAEARVAEVRAILSEPENRPGEDNNS